MIEIPQYFFRLPVAPTTLTQPKPTIADDRQAQLQQLLADMASADIPYKDLDNTVFSDGDMYSPVMVVGEGPGENEVLQKKPFVGKSGKLLQEMLDCAGILRENIYVTNVVVWRPPNNRTPLPCEIEVMKPFLERHIAIIKPQILVLVGGIAYRCVMDKPVAISKIRGQWLQHPLCERVMNIFHPSYLLRSPTHRKETWRDILQIRQVMDKVGHRLNVAHTVV